MSPKSSSKIPYRTPKGGRIATSKAPKYVPSPAAKHLGLSCPRNNRHKSPGSSPLSQPPDTLCLPLSPTNLNKPLPSPPVAQIVSPASPPKAKRTLVDATVAGHPTEDDWPTLRPKSTDAVALDDTVPSTEYENQPRASETRTASEHSNYRRSTELRSKNPYASLVDATNLQASSSTLPAYIQGGKSYPGAFRSLGRDATPLLARPRGTALESPLARKSGQRRGVIGQSSTTQNRKRISLSTPSPEPPIKVAETYTFRQGTFKPHETEQPLLGEEINTASSVGTMESQHDHAIITLPDCSIHEYPRLVPSSTDIYPIPLSHRSSQVSISTLARISTGIYEPKEDFDTDTNLRRKYLSKNAPIDRSGPVLTIADDADNVLLGDGKQTQNVTATNQAIPKKSLHNRTLSALVDHISRQKERMSFKRSFQPITPQLLVSGGPAQIDPQEPTRLPKKEYDGNYSNSSFNMSVTLRDGKSIDTKTTVASRPKDNSEERRVTKGVSESVALSAREMAFIEPPPLAQDGEANVPDQTPPLPLKNPSRQTSMLHCTHYPSRRSPISSSIDAKTIGSTMTDSSLCKNGATTKTTNRDSPRSLESHIKNTDSITKTGSRLKNVESTDQAHSYIPILRQHTRSQLTATPLPHSSEDITNSGKSFNGQGSKIKLKRSIRNIFQKDAKRHDITNPPPELKKHSITDAGYTLTKRFRSSANMSWVTQLNKTEVQKPEASSLANEATRYQPLASHLGKGGTSGGQPVSTTSSKEAANEVPPVPILSGVSNPVSSASAICPSTQPSSISVFKTILEGVKDLPINSNEHLIGLQIAEALAQCIEQSQEAKIAAQKAKQYAREAQLHSNIADINLRRLEKLCELDLPTNALNAMDELTL